MDARAGLRNQVACGVQRRYTYLDWITTAEAVGFSTTRAGTDHWIANVTFNALCMHHQPVHSKIHFVQVVAICVRRRHTLLNPSATGKYIISTCCRAWDGGCSPRVARLTFSTDIEKASCEQLFRQFVPIALGSRANNIVFGASTQHICFIRLGARSNCSCADITRFARCLHVKPERMDMKTAFCDFIALSTWAGFAHSCRLTASQSVLCLIGATRNHFRAAHMR